MTVRLGTTQTGLTERDITGEVQPYPHQIPNINTVQPQKEYSTLDALSTVLSGGSPIGQFVYDVLDETGQVAKQQVGYDQLNKSFDKSDYFTKSGAPLDEGDYYFSSVNSLADAQAWSAKRAFVQKSRDVVQNSGYSGAVADLISSTIGDPVFVASTVVPGAVLSARAKAASKAAAQSIVMGNYDYAIHGKIVSNSLLESPNKISILKTTGEALSGGAAFQAADEVMRRQLDPTRTEADSTNAIITTTLFSGILGGAFGTYQHLKSTSALKKIDTLKSDKQIFDKMADDSVGAARAGFAEKLTADDIKVQGNEYLAPFVRATGAVLGPRNRGVYFQDADMVADYGLMYGQPTIRIQATEKGKAFEDSVSEIHHAVSNSHLPTTYFADTQIKELMKAKGIDRNAAELEFYTLAQGTKDITEEAALIMKQQNPSSSNVIDAIMKQKQMMKDARAEADQLGFGDELGKIEGYAFPLLTNRDKGLSDQVGLHAQLRSAFADKLNEVKTKLGGGAASIERLMKATEDEFEYQMMQFANKRNINLDDVVEGNTGIGGANEKVLHQPKLEIEKTATKIKVGKKEYDVKFDSDFDYALYQVATSGKKGKVEEQVSVGFEPIKPLPKHLSGSKPRYGYKDKQFTVEFSSDVDRALYIVAQKSKSKADEEFRNYLLNDVGLTADEITTLSKTVRDNIKAIAKDAEAGSIKLDAVYKTKEKFNKVIKDGASETPFFKFVRNNSEMTDQEILQAARQVSDRVKELGKSGIKSETIGVKRVYDNQVSIQSPALEGMERAPKSSVKPKVQSDNLRIQNAMRVFKDDAEFQGVIDDLMEQLQQLRGAIDDVDRSAEEWADQMLTRWTSGLPGYADFIGFGRMRDKPGFWNRRVLNPVDFAKWAETNPQILNSWYFNQHGLAVGLKKKFGTHKPDVAMKQIREKYDLRAGQMRTAGDYEGATKLLDNVGRMEKDFSANIEQLQGTYAKDFYQKYGAAASVIAASKVMAGLAKLGNVVMGSLPELPAIFMTHNMIEAMPTVKDAIKFLSTSDGWKMGRVDLQASGRAFELFLNDMQYAALTSGGGIGEALIKGENYLGFARKWGQRINGQVFYDSFIRSVAGLTQQTMLVRNLRKMADGKLTAKELENLAYLGIGKGEASAFLKELEPIIHQESGLIFLNLDKMANKEMSYRIKTALDRDLRRTYLVSRSGDLPHIMMHPAMSLIMQFKSWPILATQNYMLPMLQQADGRALAAFAMMAGVGTMVSLAKEAAQGKDISNIDPVAALYAGVDTSIGGIFSEVLNPVAGHVMKMNGIEPLGGVRFYDKKTALEAFMGPSAGMLNDVFRGGYYGFQALESKMGFDVNDTSSQAAKSIMRVMPMNNFPFLGNAFKEYLAPTNN